MNVIKEHVDHIQYIGNWTIYLSVICLLMVSYYYWIVLRHNFYLKDMPGLPILPFLGNAYLILFKTPHEMMKYAVDKQKQLGNVVKVYLGHKLFVALCHPKDIEVILGSQVHLEKSAEYSLFEPWLGQGLLISKGEKWRTHRKMIAPTFHASILKSFLPVFNKNSDRLIENLRKEVGKPFDVHDYMSGITVDVLLETVMGIKKTNEDNTGYSYAMAVMKMCNILHLRHTKFWMRPSLIFNFTSYAGEQKGLLGRIHSLTDKVIKRKKVNYTERKQAGETSLYDTALKEQKHDVNSNDATANNDGYNYGSALKDDLDENDLNDVGEKKRLAFLDYMIEASQMTGNKLTDEEIYEEVNTIMFEGHDTTAAGSSFVLCMLGAYSDVQEKVVQEIDSIFGNSDRPVTFADTLEMKYLERVILETLRLYPPVPLIARKVNEDVKLATKNYILPAGTTVLIGIYAAHRLEEFYPNPEKFNPDNFLPDRCQERHYYSFIPFSAGPRSCVGRKYAMLKLKILLANIIRNFKIISEVPVKDFALQGDIILKRSDGFRIRIEERK